ncbi:MAG: N-acetyltransferase family protein [Streptosporangiaceae bacterium]
MTIRRATTDDAARIAEVHVRSWQGAYRGLIPQDYLDRLDLPPRVAMWGQILASVHWPAGGVLVAESGSRLAGFVSYGPTRDEDATQSIVGEIMAIYLVPAAWGNGLGRELMSAALAALATAGYAKATLWVLDSNERARRFYEAAGFGPDGAVREDDSRGFVLREVRYRRPLP